MRRTTGWWLTRIELAIGLGAIAVAVGLVVLPPQFVGEVYVPLHPHRWWLGLVIPAGLGGMLLGLAWMVRICRAGPEDGESSWRYHVQDLPGIVPTPRGFVASVELAIGLGATLFAAVLYASFDSPFSGPMIGDQGPTPLVYLLVPAAGIVGVLLGLAWMIRIYRTAFVDGDPSWRYRSRSRPERRGH